MFMNKPRIRPEPRQSSRPEHGVRADGSTRAGQIIRVGPRGRNTWRGHGAGRHLKRGIKGAEPPAFLQHQSGLKGAGRYRRILRCTIRVTKTSTRCPSSGYHIRRGTGANPIKPGSRSTLANGFHLARSYLGTRMHTRTFAPKNLSFSSATAWTRSTGVGRVSRGAFGSSRWRANRLNGATTSAAQKLKYHVQTSGEAGTARARKIQLQRKSARPAGPADFAILYDNCQLGCHQTLDEAITRGNGRPAVRRARWAIKLIINREWGTGEERETRTRALIIDENDRARPKKENGWAGRSSRKSRANAAACVCDGRPATRRGQDPGRRALHYEMAQTHRRVPRSFFGREHLRQTRHGDLVRHIELGAARTEDEEAVFAAETGCRRSFPCGATRRSRRALKAGCSRRIRETGKKRVRGGAEEAGALLLRREITKNAAVRGRAGQYRRSM